MQAVCPPGALAAGTGHVSELPVSFRVMTLFPELFCRRRLDASKRLGISASDPGRPCKLCPWSSCTPGPWPGQLGTGALRGAAGLGGAARWGAVHVASGGSPACAWQARLRAGGPRGTPGRGTRPGAPRTWQVVSTEASWLPCWGGAAEGQARHSAASVSPSVAGPVTPASVGQWRGLTARSPEVVLGSNSAPASLRPPRWVSFTVKDPKTCDFTSGNKNTRVRQLPHVQKRHFTSQAQGEGQAGGGERAWLAR